MGLKDELVVANNPPEETRMSESDTTVAEEEVSASPGVSSSVVSVQSEAPEEETANEDPEAEDEEEEVVDPMDTLKEECSQHSEAQHLKEVWDECTERVSSKSNTTETCTQEIYDFLHHVDHCVSKTIFSHLK